MKLYLGLVGAEVEISTGELDFEKVAHEIKDIVECADGTLHVYYVGVKNSFNFNYNMITAINLATIVTEYDRHTTLNLKVEKTTADTYDNYSVIFYSDFPDTVYKDLSTFRLHRNVSFVLREV